MTISSIFLLFVCATATLLATCSSIRIELHHVDAKANITTAERFRRAAARAHLRLQSFGVTATVSMGGWDYIAQFAIGTPPQEVHAVVDSMSSLVWTQCSTCRPLCFRQDLGIYDFSRSTTGVGVSCNDSMCAKGYETQPCTGDDGRAGACLVRTTLHFAADIAGELRTEEFTFGELGLATTKVELAFGCITDTENIAALDLSGSSGVIGLGWGNLSMVSQVGGNRRFSYCLQREQVFTSTLFVGPSAGLNGEAPFASAPLVTYAEEEPFSSFYNLLLATVSVGKVELDIHFEALPEGRVSIDSTYPFMLLCDEAYQELGHEVRRQLGSSSLVPSPVDWLDLCVANEDVSRLVPPLVFHFVGGGNWTIPAENYWGPVDADTSCMLILNSALRAPPPMRRMSIIGNYMQLGMNILYDLDNYQVSFQAGPCRSRFAE